MLDQSCIGLIVALIGRLWCGRGTQSWRNYMKSWRTLIGTCSDDKKSFPLFHEHRFLVRSIELLDMMCKQKRNYPIHLFVSFFVCFINIFMTWCRMSVCLYFSYIFHRTLYSLSCLPFSVSLSQGVLMRLWLKRGGKQLRSCCSSLQIFLLCTTALNSKNSSG